MSKKDPEFNYLLPPEECEMIYKILGREPDLDPCGHPDQLLKAGTVMYGDPDNDDGMTAKWAELTNKGLVVLNPCGGERKPDHVDLNFAWYPFSRWLMKASAEAQRGATILAFLPAYTDRRWFHQNATQAASLCFLERRVKSMLPNPAGGAPVRGEQPSQPHLYAVWTKDKGIFERFYEALAPRGFVADPCPVD